MNRTIFQLLFLGLLGFFGCKPEQVDFIKIDHAKVLGSEGKFVRVEADAILYNPNKTKGQVKDVDITVSYKDEEVAHIIESSVVKVGGEEEFAIPLQMLLDMEKIQSNWLSNLVSILKDKSVELHFSGHIKIKIHGIGYKVPVDYTEKIAI